MKKILQTVCLVSALTIGPASYVIAEEDEIPPRHSTTHTPDGRPIDDGRPVEPLPSEVKVPKPDVFNDVTRKIQQKEAGGAVGN